MSPLDQGIEEVLSVVNGDVYRDDKTGTALIVLHDDPYVIYVSADGDTASAYLVTMPPAEIVRAARMALELDESDVAGWTTGWEA